MQSKPTQICKIFNGLCFLTNRKNLHKFAKRKKRNMLEKNETPKKLRFYPLEEFREISLGEDDDKLQLRYAISNYGRLVSFSLWADLEYGRFLNGSKQDGYKIWRYSVRDETNKLRFKHKFLYKLVAEYFIPKTSDEQVYVLHLNRNRANDHVENLKWATKAEMLEHSKKSPFVITARKKQLALIAENRKHKGNKLTSTQVMFLKKRLLDPNRKTRLKILARQYGVSEMQLYRIKTGENWGHIKV
jgi:hypothetical protein